MEYNNIVQVAVINKTESLFVRDTQNPMLVTNKLADEFVELSAKESMIITAKTDGTCGIICRDTNNNFFLMRRQDIKIGNRNYNIVMNNGIYDMYSGTPCFITKMIRGSGKTEITVPLYIFYLTNDHKPEIEFNHIIGFTPIMHDFAEDKYAITAIEGLNGTSDFNVVTTFFEGNLDIPVKVIPVVKLMDKKNIMTVEILGSKISNRYGYKNDKHFVNPHGSIVYPKEMCPVLDYESLHNWFKNDTNNRWANVEGIVIHFPINGKRFKLHRGHVGLEHSWKTKKYSGILFCFE